MPPSLRQLLSTASPVLTVALTLTTTSRATAQSAADGYVPPPPPPAGSSAYPELKLGDRDKAASAGAGATPKEDAANAHEAERDPADDRGPKIMGFDHFMRLSVGIVSGRYTDSQENAAAEVSDGQNAKVTGRRFVLERYPVIAGDGRKKQYGYTILEFREETFDVEYWEARRTYIGLLGFVWPRFRIIAPVAGVHVEYNRIDLEHEDTPEVLTSDLRAFILGVHFRQKVWGYGPWFGVFYEGRVHLLNPTMPNNGMEIEAGIGTAQAYGWPRADVSLDYQYRTFKAHRQSDGDSDEEIQVESTSRSTIATVTLWL